MLRLKSNDGKNEELLKMNCDEEMDMIERQTELPAILLGDDPNQ